MDGWQGLWGIAFFVLGGAATELNGWITHRRQRAAKREEDEDALRQRGEEFELQHLVEVNQLLRSLAQRQWDLSSAKWPAPWSAGDAEDIRRQTDAALQELLDANGALSAQVGFILADPVREAVLTAIGRIDDRTRSILDAPDHYAPLEKRLKGPGMYSGTEEMTDAVNAAYEAISARVRAVYAGRSSERG